MLDWPRSRPGGNIILNRLIAAAALSLLFAGNALAAAPSPAAEPGWTSLLPAVLTILVALVLRSVVPALLAGLWVGAVLVRGGSPADYLMGLLDALQVYVVNALADADRASILVFTLMIGGLVGIITRNGGMHALVERVIHLATNRRSAQLSVGGMGLLIFFDDYANTLVVGNTAQSMTDRLQVSRQKLAYIVDSTAAPIACIALVTTWIGYEVSLIDDALSTLDGFSGGSGYTIFLNSLAYSFYPIFAVAFVIMVAASGRDFGPMLAAEEAAARGESTASSKVTVEELAPKPGVKAGVIDAILPILVMLATLVAGFFVTGSGDGLVDIVGSADAYKSMVWASMTGVAAGFVVSLLRGSLGFEETLDAWFSGVRSVLFGAIILALAWALSDVTSDLGASTFLVGLLGDNLQAAWLPAAVFLLAAITAFGTGTSWGTMGILVPLVVPLAWAVLQSGGSADDMHILYSSVACVLAGAVWGDHCSPISDTTVLSSVASGCDHIEHVRTQLPYALLVGGIALLAGTIPAAFGVSPFVCLVAGAVALFFLLRLLGRRSGPVMAKVAHEGTE